MLIVSDFHDYYDIMMKHGIDKAVVYRRQKEEIKFSKDSRLKRTDFPVFQLLHDDARMSFPWERGGSSHEYEADWLIVGVCGKLHPAVRLTKTYYCSDNKKPSNFIAYSLAALVAFVRKYFSKRDRERFFQEPDRFRKKRNPMGIFDHLGTHTFFDTLYQREDAGFFRAINAPIGIYSDRPRFDETDLVINPRLADFSFQKIMDPHTIYQELAMYISGVLGIGSPKTVEISDVDMAAKKGFDVKASFRTDPGTRKPRWLKRQLRDG